MQKFESALDKTRILANVLMLLLLVGNIFFSIHYIENIKRDAIVKEDNTPKRLASARFLKEFIAIVLNKDGTVSTDDRIKLEYDIRQIEDDDLIQQWRAFVASTDAETAQQNAVKLMAILTDKILQE